MAKFSDKKQGKEIGSADTYAKPHTMSGKEVKAQPSKGQSGAEFLDGLNISVGTVSKRNGDAVKTSGIKIRGTGAATKGTMARGPMG
jgi:hypothetical protein